MELSILFYFRASCLLSCSEDICGKKLKYFGLLLQSHIKIYKKSVVMMMMIMMMMVVVMMILMVMVVMMMALIATTLK